MAHHTLGGCTSACCAIRRRSRSTIRVSPRRVSSVRACSRSTARRTCGTGTTSCVPSGRGKYRVASSDSWCETTRRLVDEIADEDNAELRSSLANPLAIGVIAEALGLDGADETMVAQLAEWYRSIVASVSGVSTGAVPSAEGDEAFAALRDVVLGHLHAAHPSVLTDAAGHAGDVVAAGAAGAAGSADSAAGLSDDEVVSNAAVIMFGGIETTEGMILNVVWHLLTNADALAAVRADPTLVAAAVEESLRLEPAAAVVDRYATTDVIVAGAAGLGRRHGCRVAP